MSNEEWDEWKQKDVSWDVAAADSETVAATAGERSVSSSPDSPHSENHDTSASAESHHTTPSPTSSPLPSQSLNPDLALPAPPESLPHISDIHHLLNGPPNTNAHTANDASNHQTLGLDGYNIGVNLATGTYGEGDTWGRHMSLMDYLHAPLMDEPDLLLNANASLTLL